MSRRPLLAAAVTALTAACAAGPSYTPTMPVPAETRVGAGTMAPAARTFFDSLASARAADSLRSAMPTPSVVTPPIGQDAVGDVAWLAVLHDSSLTALVETALQQNRDLQSATARIEEYRALVTTARAPLFPTINATASAATNRTIFGAAGSVSYALVQAAGTLAWELDFWGKTRRGLEAARDDLAGQDAAKQAVALSLVSDVASGYLQLLELDQERDIAERTLESRRATLALARSRFRQGVASELDVRQFEAQVGAPAVTLAQVERLRAQQEHRLNVLVGEKPRPVARGRSLAEAAAALDVPDSLSSALLARRPDVRQAERAYAAATARIGVAEAARLPTVTISGFYGLQAQSLPKLFSNPGDGYQLQAGVSLPLFTGGRLSAARDAATARAAQARAAYEQATLVALQEAGDALVSVRTTRDEVAALETQAAALRRALHLAELRYRTGISNYLEVLDAQRSLFGAEIALSQGQLRQLTAGVQLYRALGGSWTR